MASQHEQPQESPSPPTPLPHQPQQSLCLAGPTLLHCETSPHKPSKRADAEAEADGGEVDAESGVRPTDKGGETASNAAGKQQHEEGEEEVSRLKTILRFVAGNREVVVLPLSLFILLFFLAVDIDSQRPEASKGAAVLLITALWWFTEVLPLTITSLLPLVLYPLLGVGTVKHFATKFFKGTSFLFVAGFFIGLAVERWGLHSRAVCSIISRIGTRLELVIGGFMISVWLLSMWISNTATILCMLPMAQAFLSSLPVGNERFQSAFLLAIGYSATVGGIATPVGTPTNGIFIEQFASFWPHEAPISFAKFFLCALPLSAMLLGMVWLGFCVAFVWSGQSGSICGSSGRQLQPTASTLRVDPEVFIRMRAELGKATFEQMVVSADLALLIVLWFTADPIGDFPGWSSFVSEDLDSASIGLLLTLPLFFLPCGARLPDVLKRAIGEDRCRSLTSGRLKQKEQEPRRILDWDAIKGGFQWEILFVFGGGAIIADGTVSTGLASWVAEGLAGAALSEYFFLLLVVAVICFVTEVVSNMASLSIFGSIIAATAQHKGYDPVQFLLAVCFSSSFAFMLPMAGGPNMVVYSTGKIPVSTMVRTGLLLNCAAIFLGGTYMSVIMPSLLSSYAHLPAPAAG